MIFSSHLLGSRFAFQSVGQVTMLVLVLKLCRVLLSVWGWYNQNVALPNADPLMQAAVRSGIAIGLTSGSLVPSGARHRFGVPMVTPKERCYAWSHSPPPFFKLKKLMTLDA